MSYVVQQEESNYMTIHKWICFFWLFELFHKLVSPHYRTPIPPRKLSWYQNRTEAKIQSYGHLLTPNHVKPEDEIVVHNYIRIDHPPKEKDLGHCHLLVVTCQCHQHKNDLAYFYSSYQILFSTPKPKCHSLHISTVWCQCNIGSDISQPNGTYRPYIIKTIVSSKSCQLLSIKKNPQPHKPYKDIFRLFSNLFLKSQRMKIKFDAPAGNIISVRLKIWLYATVGT